MEDCGFPCTLEESLSEGQTLPWITRELRVLMRTRNYHCKKAKKTGSEEDWKHYKELRNEVTLKLRKAKLQYFRALSKSQSSNKTKKTWTEINRLLGRKGRGAVETLRRDTHTEVLTDEQAIAEEFGDFFSSIVGMTNDRNPREVMYDVCGLLKACDSSFKFSKIEEEDVFKLLKVLDPNKAISVDKISGKLLRMTACGISRSLTSLFNSSLKCGDLPSEWKAALVIHLCQRMDQATLWGTTDLFWYSQWL